MDIETVRAFLMWCTIVNVGMLTFSSLLCTFGGNFVYRAHSRWYPMPRETFNVVLYAFIGLYKIVVIVFFLVPYIAISIIG